ncbi:CDP-glycerol glycerophosphotransferase family protein [Weissella paramesenteroides]|uniref:CDP-glycerol glycerophosphotransferase family protein n=1 Tax=Weissella paramesenteroides TaxID=1249 RepID=UPI0023A9380C|nr:CDP-glycerol glycerophosphotransferase family protein [Weissella paramesenteroides]WEA53647.1 CDP-glycerol glycerophosphotransferase family protein [Weissella paramesenteroides]
MENMSVGVKKVSIQRNSVLINVENISIQSVFLQKRKSEQLIECAFLLENKQLIVTIPNDLNRGRFDLYIQINNSEKSIRRIKYSDILKKDVPDRYFKVVENLSNDTYVYFTMDGHIAVEVINKDNNGHFNQFSGKLTVDKVFRNASGSIKLYFNTSHRFNNLSVLLMEKDNDKCQTISFKAQDTNVFIHEEFLSLKTPHLIVFKYIHNGVFQSRWLDFNKWLSDEITTIGVENMMIDFHTGKLSLDFSIDATIPLLNLELIVRNRNTREEVTSVNTEGNLTHCVINYHDFPLIEESKEEFLNETYDGNIFDFLVRPILTWLPTINYCVRLNYNELLEDEYWFKRSDQITQLVMMYKTKIGKLAARFAYLPIESYEHYRNLLSNKEVYQLHTNKTKTLLVSEYIDKAQDTGLSFFKYMVDYHSDEFDTYYVITEHSKDLPNLANYMKHVVFFRSVKHVDLVMSADYLAHSHSSIYAFPFNSIRMNKVRLEMKKIFLQHGIMGVRDLSNLYNNDPLFTNKIIVSSDREKKIAINQMGYQVEDVVLTGLSRFDRLIQHRNDDDKKLKKKILIMPSWRKGQNELTDEDFKKTIFYQTWEKMLNNKEFISLIKENNLKVNFYLHHNFQKYTHLFSSDLVKFIPEGQYSVQNLLISHGILITDFSSVGLDFSLLNRSVIYYNFDNSFNLEELEKVHFLPGPIISNQDELLMTLQKTIKRPKLKWKYRLYQKKNLYKFTDQSANERIYKVLDEKL